MNPASYFFWSAFHSTLGVCGALLAIVLAMMLGLFAIGFVVSILRRLVWKRAPADAEPDTVRDPKKA